MTTQELLLSAAVLNNILTQEEVERMLSFDEDSCTEEEFEEMELLYRRVFLWAVDPHNKEAV
jgi:hypothetical protein